MCLIIFSDTYSGLSGGWVAGTADTNQYIEVDMSLPYKFTKVYIQGREDADEWVTSFKILYYNDITTVWDTYTDTNGQDVRTYFTSTCTTAILEKWPHFQRIHS